MENYEKILADLFSAEEAEQNRLEGWDIFHCWSSCGGDWQLQRIDDDEMFFSDKGAWLFVRGMASKGNERCIKALNFLKSANPIEYNRIETLNPNIRVR